MAQMSLTRVLSEIKSIEQKIVQLPVVVGIGVEKTLKVEGESCTIEEFKRTSQSRFDAWMGLSSRLVKLRVARNLANATTKVIVAGKPMTIDEAIAMKALLNIQKQAVEGFKSQISKVDLHITKADNEVKAAMEKSVQATITSSAPLSQEQVKLFQDMYQNSLGKVLAIGDAVKPAIKNLEEYIASFTAEIDYVLSEANASTKVDV
jgi:hypothetical protein